MPQPATMSMIETDQISAQDDLPPEILRRLQVEELWARRTVLAELMNSERLDAFKQRCAAAAAAPAIAPGEVVAGDRLYGAGGSG